MRASDAWGSIEIELLIYLLRSHTARARCTNS